MKKIILFAITSMAFALSYADAYKFDYSMCAFFDSAGKEVGSDASFALVAYTPDVDINSFNLNAGDIFTNSSWMNGDDSSGIFTLSTGTTVDSQVLGNVIIDNTTLPSTLTGNENLAIIVWIPSSSSISGGDSYVVFSPTMTGGNTGITTDAWTLVAANQGVFNLNLLTKSDGGTLDNIYTTLNKTVIPEPSTVAAVFGAFALGLVMLRRRRA